MHIAHAHIHTRAALAAGGEGERIKAHDEACCSFPPACQLAQGTTVVMVEPLPSPASPKLMYWDNNRGGNLSGTFR